MKALNCITLLTTILVIIEVCNGLTIPIAVRSLFQQVVHHKNMELFHLKNTTCPLPNATSSLTSSSTFPSVVSLFGLELISQQQEQEQQQQTERPIQFVVVESDGCQAHPTLAKYVKVMESASQVIENLGPIGSYWTQDIQTIRFCVGKNEDELNQFNLLLGDVRINKQQSKQGLKASLDVTLRRSLVDFLPSDIPNFVFKYYEDSIQEIKAMEESGRLKKGSRDDILRVLPEIMASASFKMFASLLEQDVIACFLCIILGGILVPLVANIIMYLIGLRLCDICQLSDTACTTLLTLLLYYVYLILPILAAILWQICKGFCLEF